MPSNNRDTIFITKIKAIRQTAISAPVGLTDSVIAIEHWEKLKTKCGKSETDMLKALTRKVKPIRSLGKGSKRGKS
jgi:hypothetical protein